jgi:hypothetical protein
MSSWLSSFLNSTVDQCSPLEAFCGMTGFQVLVMFALFFIVFLCLCISRFVNWYLEKNKIQGDSE